MTTSSCVSGLAATQRMTRWRRLIFVVAAGGRRGESALPWLGAGDASLEEPSFLACMICGARRVTDTLVPAFFFFVVAAEAAAGFFGGGSSMTTMRREFFALAASAVDWETLSSIFWSSSRSTVILPVMLA